MEVPSKVGKEVSSVTALPAETKLGIMVLHMDSQRFRVLKANVDISGNVSLQHKRTEKLANGV